MTMHRAIKEARVVLDLPTEVKIVHAEDGEILNLLICRPLHVEMHSLPASEKEKVRAAVKGGG